MLLKHFNAFGQKMKNVSILHCPVMQLQRVATDLQVSLNQSQARPSLTHSYKMQPHLLSSHMCCNAGCWAVQVSTVEPNNKELNER